MDSRLGHIQIGLWQLGAAGTAEEAPDIEVSAVGAGVSSIVLGSRIGLVIAGVGAGVTSVILRGPTLLSVDAVGAGVAAVTLKTGRHLAISGTGLGVASIILRAPILITVAGVGAGATTCRLLAFLSSDPLTLLIANVNRNDFLKPTGIRIDRQLNGADSCTLELQDWAEIYVPPLGAMVEIYQGTTLRFSGLAEETEEGDRSWGECKRQIRAGGWKRILDRRIVFASYQAGYNLAGIVLDLLANLALGEGLTMRHVDAGPTFTEKIVFQGVTLAQAFDQLAVATGLDWYVDWDRDIHFSQFATNPAPFSITDTSENWRRLRVRRNLRDYRNVQYVRNNTGLSPLRTDTFMGDGVIRFFVTRYPLWAAPAVTVDGVPKTVGELGVDSGKDWYWIGPSSYGVENLAPNAPLAAGSVLAVTYPSDFPNVVCIEDAAQIAARAAAEGGNGRHEAIEDVSDVAEEATALTIAQGLLDRYGVSGPPVDVEFETDTAGLEPGQVLTVAVTKPPVAGAFLIESISGVWIPSANTARSLFRWQVRATSGWCQGDWKAVWARLADKARHPKPVELETHSWDLAETIPGITPEPLTIGTDLANPVIIQRSGIVQSAMAAAKTAPTGQDAIIDIKINGVSIFRAGMANHLIIPDGSTAVQTKTDFSAGILIVNPGDVLTVDVEQVGSTVAGQDLTVYLSILPTGARQG